MANWINLKKLIHALEDDTLLREKQIQFCMADWFAYLPYPTVEVGRDGVEHSCRTSACIAGHAAILARAEPTKLMSSNVRDIAMDWLDLDDDTAATLFHPRELPYITAEWAISVLKYFLYTNTVDWERFCPESLKEKVYPHRVNA